MSDVLTDLAQCTPAWLTQRLRAGGILQEGEVAAIRPTKINQTNVSFVAHLEITYTKEEPSAPTKLFLKNSQSRLYLGRARNQILQ